MQRNIQTELNFSSTPAGEAREAASLCAGHAQQFGGESPLPNLMEVKG